MKTKYLVIATLALLIAAIGNATEIPKMNIVPTSDEKAMVTFNSPKAFPIEVSICSENGEMVYNWKSEQPQQQLTRIFDLSKIGYGYFNVCINYGMRSINRELSVQKNVYLNIYKDGEHVTGVNLGKTLDIQKCLDFSKLEKGKYDVILSDTFKDHNFIVQK